MEKVGTRHACCCAMLPTVFEGTGSSSGDSEAGSRSLKTHVAWGLIARCCFSLCGSLIHNAGAWNLVDLYIMCVEMMRLPGCVIANAQLLQAGLVGQLFN